MARLRAMFDPSTLGILCLLLSWNRLPPVVAIWKCDKTCKTNYAVPHNVKRMRDALLYKPMAEYDFHYKCVSEREAETVNEMELVKRYHGLTKRLHSGDGKYEHLQECPDAKRVLPGIKEMMYGYNIVTDQYSKETGHLEVLDLTSRNEYGATVEDPYGGKDGTGECFFVPDAFASQGIGIDFAAADAENEFKATGGTDAEDYRKKTMDSTSSELSVDVKVGIGPVAIRAGYTKSKSHSTFSELKGSRKSSMDTSSIVYIQQVFSAVIQTPQPTHQLIRRWKNLAKMNTSTEKQREEAYNDYFFEAGTHFFNSAMLGGKFTVDFLAANSSDNKEKSKTESRANCVAMKAGATYKLFSVDVANKECESSYEENATNKTVTDYMENYKTHCRGGNPSKCPNSLAEGKGDALTIWGETLRSLPVPIKGLKRWITELIDQILKGYGDTGFESKIYERIIMEFGDVNDNVEQAANRLREFRDTLFQYLYRYLENAADDYESILSGGNGTGFGRPSNGTIAWNLVTGHELIDPKSHVGWHTWELGKWGPIEFCPPGEFAKAASINIHVLQMGDDIDWEGMTKVHLFCTNGKGLISSAFHSGLTSRQVTCPGYLIGYRIRSYQINGINIDDDRGATNLQYRCKIEGSGEIRKLEFYFECERAEWSEEQKQRCKDEQAKGEWAEWQQCKEGYGISGLKTRTGPHQGKEGNDAGILDVGYWCNKLPENAFNGSAPENTTALPCERETDLVIVLDSSSSVLEVDYMVGIEFSARLAEAFLPPKGKSHIGFVIFSEFPQVSVALDNHMETGGILFFIRNQHRSEIPGSHTDLAINEAIKQLGGTATKVPKKMIVLTDGASSNNQMTIEAANKAKSKGIISFSVGIGTVISQDELLAIAGGNKDHRFNVDTFDDLLQTIPKISTEICDA